MSDGQVPKVLARGVPQVRVPFIITFPPFPITCTMTTLHLIGTAQWPKSEPGDTQLRFPLLFTSSPQHSRAVQVQATMAPWRGINRVTDRFPPNSHISTNQHEQNQEAKNNLQSPWRK